MDVKLKMRTTAPFFAAFRGSRHPAACCYRTNTDSPPKSKLWPKLRQTEAKDPA
jgi:hypothetical protein